jgi:hypothetical protein
MAETSRCGTTLEDGASNTFDLLLVGGDLHEGGATTRFLVTAGGLRLVKADRGSASLHATSLAGLETSPEGEPYGGLEVPAYESKAC